LLRIQRRPIHNSQNHSISSSVYASLLPSVFTTRVCASNSFSYQKRWRDSAYSFHSLAKYQALAAILRSVTCHRTLCVLYPIIAYIFLSGTKKITGKTGQGTLKFCVLSAWQCLFKYVTLRIYYKKQCFYFPRENFALLILYLSFRASQDYNI